MSQNKNSVFIIAEAGVNHSGDIKKAFKILDTNNDGTITKEDFTDLFNSHGGNKMDDSMWKTILDEADINGDGIISF